jgi:hypothetical protein
MEPTPPGFFTLEELQNLKSFEGLQLADVNYYLWLNQNGDEAGNPYRFLYALELVFDAGEALLLTSGEDSEAIRIIDAATLLDTAKMLHELNGAISIQRINAGAQPLWQPAETAVLTGIRLSPNDEGLYHSDALVLDFGNHRVLVALSEKEGLVLGKYE